MKKVLLTMMCLGSMMAASMSFKAQEVTITLMPGYNWISIPCTDTLDFATALGSFTPLQGDIIKSQVGNATYMESGQWRGSISLFYPGHGYMYKSNRTEPVTVTFNAQQPNPQGNDHEYVDLGLPSGILWATCNVGADTPEEYGDYFAWGETQSKDYYDWSTYQYCNGSQNTLTKYCSNSIYGYNDFTDDLTTLLPEDDAASANWGDDWRMPTKAEWQELYNNTTVTWTTQNDVNGRLFTASNGNSLFLPAAGYRNESNLYSAGNQSNYWSSSLSTDIPSFAWYLYFYSGSYSMSGYSRSYGRSVRAVRYASQNTSFIIDATVNPEEGGIVSGTGSFQPLTECTLTATPSTDYYFVSWTEDGEIVSISPTYVFQVISNRTLVANFSNTVPTGAINGLFSVSEIKRVFFSQGNLQYQASTDIWRFAENQWDYVGGSLSGNEYGNVYENGVKCDNSLISSSYDGWIDLFGWGTSGYNHGAVCYQPWSTSEYAADYWAYGSYSYNLFSRTGQADWGYNAINNGGNQENQWRTLNHNEWYWVLFNRSTVSGIRYAKAQVNGVNGVILLPDNWDASIYSLNETNERYAQFSSNVITASIWEVLEANGAVFLPAAGARQWGSIYGGNSFGSYWSASYDYTNDAYMMQIGYNNIDEYSYYRYHGLSARLVHDLE